MSADPLHSRLVHSIHASLSERGRRWPFRMGARELVKVLAALDLKALAALQVLYTEQGQAALIAKLKEAGIQ